MASPILAGLTILMLGDSHFATQGYLVTTLQDALIEQGAKVATYGACGASVSVWVEGGVAPCGLGERVQSGPVHRDGLKPTPVPLLSDLIAKWHPNLIIVGAGDTMAGYGQAKFPAGWVHTEVTSLIGSIAAAHIPCVWIGPGWGTEGGPYFKTYAKVQEASAYLAANVAPCRYIDSLKFSAPGEWPTFDGQHYTLPGYQKWGMAIDKAILALAESH